MSCLICSLVLDNKEKHTLPCNHSFHYNCIKESIKYNVQCPYCREEYPLIDNYSQNNNKVIKYSIKKRRSIKIRLLNTEYIIIKLDNFKENITPNYWINNLYKYCVIPLHTLTINGEEYLMTLYLRLVLLFSLEKNLITIVKKKDFMNRIFLDTDDTLYFSKTQNKLDKESFLHCYEWIFDVLHELKNEFKFCYYNFINTLLFDCVLEYLREIPTPKSEYQAILVSGMYKIIEIINKDSFNNFSIKELLKKLVYYSDNSCTVESIGKYNKYIGDYLERYTIMNK